MIKFASNVIDSHLHDIVKDLEKSKCSEDPKAALIKPIFKKNESNNIENYSPVRVLSRVSKIYEKFMHNYLSFYAKTMLWSVISAYKKFYSSNHVLLRLKENWKKLRDNKKFVDTFLMNLSKAFACIPHGLLAAKLYA